MKEQRFGIEVEMTGLTRQKAAEVIAGHFGRTVNQDGGYYGVYSVLDGQNRSWKVMSDGSITTQKKEGSRIVSADGSYSVEVVSPICRYEDIETIQEIVRKLREAGMLVNKTCGIHIHLDASPHNANTLRNITNIMASKEDMIYKAMQVEVARERQYCKKVEQSFLDEINRKKPHTLDEVSHIWYHGGDGHREHYHDSRYHCLNLHSVFQKGTIEFRLFNSTTKSTFPLPSGSTLKAGIRTSRRCLDAHPGLPLPLHRETILLAGMNNPLRGSVFAARVPLCRLLAAGVAP